jgi:formate hydrogenlyase transcriptional activator
MMSFEEQSPMVQPQESEFPAEATPDSVIQRYRALLDMGDVLARRQSLSELFADLAVRLQKVARFDLLIFALHDPGENLMRLTLLDGRKKPAAIEMRIDSSTSGWTWENQQSVVIPELPKEQRFPHTVKYLCEQGINSACLLPLTTPDRRLGALAFGSASLSAYTQGDLEFLQRIAELAALAIDNVQTRQALHEDKNRLELLVEISRTLSSSLEFERIFPVIADGLRRVMSLDYAAVAISDKHKDGVNLYLLHPPVADCALGEFVASADSISVPAMRERKVKCYGREELQRARSSVAHRLLDQGVGNIWCFPLITSRGVVGTLNVASKQEHVFASADQDLMAQIVNHVAIALENASAYREIAELKAKVAEEKLYLEDEIRTELHFEEIIGESAQIKRVLADVRTVACSDANVLILGETGTGKELIARAIHRMSVRSDHSFIKLNCAAIPTGLLESELFGHEKGAFTGALIQKVGRLELANGGTVFLDEVGDIPLELQPKLLRVLQDQEFERLGSNRTVKVNVRLIAATNRDLASLVVAREFRSDLYYRLRVFPILVPPLRDRRQDIPLLVRYFVQRFSRRMNKGIESIPAATMDVLTSWDWPGNVRELENFLERSVILSKGPALTIPAAELKPLTETGSRRDTSLETAEREHILRILRETSGVISGVRGAAARLGLKRTTLQSKMQKLGISRLDYQD